MFYGLDGSGPFEIIENLEKIYIYPVSYTHLFYDILFGYRNKRMEDDTLRFVSSYAEIPVLITDLKE